MFLAVIISEVPELSFRRKLIRKRGRAVEGNSLENCHGATHQEFESLRFLKSDTKENLKYGEVAERPKAPHC